MPRKKLPVVKAEVDMVRDPNAPCADFLIGKPAGECESDGHYRCYECVHLTTCPKCKLRTSMCECRPTPVWR